MTRTTVCGSADYAVLTLVGSTRSVAKLLLPEELPMRWPSSRARLVIGEKKQAPEGKVTGECTGRKIRKAAANCTSRYTVSYFGQRNANLYAFLKPEITVYTGC